MAHLSRAFAALTLSAFACMTTAFAQSAAVDSFYVDRKVQMVIPSSPGGGYDLYGRLFARHMGRHIPGNPVFVPANMPGASGVVAAQYIFSAAPQDGSVLGHFYATAIIDPVVNAQSRAKFDPNKFTFIGSATAESSICYVSAKSRVKRFEDAMTHDVVLGSTGARGKSSDYPNAYNSLLGTKFKVVTGYPGINEIGLAIERGEIDGTCGSSWSVMTTGRPHWLADGVMRIIAQENNNAHPDIAKLGTPLTRSFAKSEESSQVLEFMYAQAAFGRPFAMGPNVPPARVEIVRKAFSAALDDPELRSEAQRMKLEFSNPMDGPALQAAVARLTATPKRVIDATNRAIGVN
ncbi:MAG: hypothetical protein Q8M31_23950 [Beijerinckiaceae bacterium]|nr:hypothetical protein [Beijerinckiaceae bacterium]